MENSHAQSEELLALESIYDERNLFIDHTTPPRGRFTADVQLPQPFHVICKLSSGHDDNQAKCEEQTIKIKIEHLPPLNLYFELPEGYPTRSPPAFLLSCNWLRLDQISALCRKLESLWKNGEKEVVLFNWTQFLQEESLTFLDITDFLDISRLSEFKRFQVAVIATRKRIQPTHKKLGQSSRISHTLHKSNLKNTDIDNHLTRSTKNKDDEQRSVLNDTNCKSADFFTLQESFDETKCLGKNENIAKTLSAREDSEKYEFKTDVQDSKINEGNLEVLKNEEACESGYVFRPSIYGGHGTNDLRAVLDLNDGKVLLSKLEEYDKLKKHDAFKRSWFMCKTCLTEKQGVHFMQFNNCHHLYCRECMHSYFEIQIRDGNVCSLICPEDKCTSEANPRQVKELVTEELFLKYEELLLSRTLESMSDIAYCPRQFCQCPLVIESGSAMGCCPGCNFVFCTLCKMAYHGIAPCKFRPNEKKEICNRYMESRGDERLEMEQRYGRHVLQLLVDNYLSEEWIDSYSKRCPHCKTSIEKTDGCNKITCVKCGTYFCWLCMARLKPTNPYGHYSDSSSKCYDQLFHGMFEDDDNFEPGAFL